MKLYHFIFKGFKKFKSNSGFLSFNYYLSIFLIAFSLSAIILTDSLTSGYKTEIINRVKSLNPDYKITSNLYNFISKDTFRNFNNEIDEPHLNLIPYIEKPGVIINKRSNNYSSFSQREEVYIVGLDFNLMYQNHPLSQYLNKSDIILNDNEIIIGKYLSEKVKKDINDEIIILSYDEIKNSFIANTFIVKNIYDTGTETDEYLVYSNINSINDINDNYYCDGIYVYIDNGYSIENFKINNDFFNKEKISYSSLMKFLNSFDKPVKFLMWIVLFLSIYSLSALIYNFIIDKRRDFKILHILGCSHKKLKKIMIFLTFYISLIGIFFGLLSSILFIYFQNKFEIISLPSKKIFQISILTADFNLFHFILYPILILILSILVTIYVFNKNVGLIKDD